MPTLNPLHKPGKPILSKIAGGDILQNRLVKFDSTYDKVVVATNGTALILGITGVGDGPANASPMVASGSPVTVYTSGYVRAKAGGVVSLGAKVTAGAAGVAVAASAGDNFIGYAMTDGVSGDIITILIDRGTIPA